MKKLMACSALTLSMVASSLAFSADTPAATTIRTLSGAQPTQSLSANATALLVIDYQNEYLKRFPKPPRNETIWKQEELPDDFICPLCKHPASDFEKVVKKTEVK